MSEEELHANLPIILVAQTDTVTSALSGLIVCLMNAPEIHLQVEEEVRSAFQCRSDINIEKWRRCECLTLTSRESFGSILLG